MQPSDVTLSAMTWSHPRGYDPVVACSGIWRDRTGVAVQWDKRSLQDFESFPVEELARRYDLIVIDHPHIGQVTREGCLLPLDGADHTEEAAALAKASVGPSFASYTWDGRQWALPIDAAAQVQAWRPDLMAGPATTWAEVAALADAGRVLCPMRAPHSLMVFFTLAANLGRACATVGPGDLIDAAAGAEVYALMRDLAERIDPECFEMDPIAVSERMAEAASSIACAPLIYGYVNYAIAGFRERRLSFADIPSAGDGGPVGSTLGGTGIAISARTAHPQAAMDFAYWLAGPEAQTGPFAAAGGQPGHRAAWDDPGVNARVSDFFAHTKATLDGAWVRPRHDGYMEFQSDASERINRALKAGEDGRRLIADLNDMFRESFR